MLRFHGDVLALLHSHVGAFPLRIGSENRHSAAASPTGCAPSQGTAPSFNSCDFVALISLLFLLLLCYLGSRKWRPFSFFRRCKALHAESCSLAAVCSGPPSGLRAAPSQVETNLRTMTVFSLYNTFQSGFLGPRAERGQNQRFHTCTAGLPTCSGR